MDTLIPRTKEEADVFLTDLYSQIAQGWNPALCAGWVWYCDNCDTGGNGDSRHECEFIAGAHIDYHEYEVDPDDPESIELDSDCDITIAEIQR